MDDILITNGLHTCEPAFAAAVRNNLYNIEYFELTSISSTDYYISSILPMIPVIDPNAYNTAEINQEYSNVKGYLKVEGPCLVTSNDINIYPLNVKQDIPITELKEGESIDIIVGLKIVTAKISPISTPFSCAILLDIDYYWIQIEDFDQDSGLSLSFPFQLLSLRSSKELPPDTITLEPGNIYELGDIAQQMGIYENDQVNKYRQFFATPTKRINISYKWMSPMKNILYIESEGVYSPKALVKKAYNQVLYQMQNIQF